MEKIVTPRIARNIETYVLSLKLPENTFTEVIVDTWCTRGYDYYEVKTIVQNIQKKNNLT